MVHDMILKYFNVMVFFWIEIVMKNYHLKILNLIFLNLILLLFLIHYFVLFFYCLQLSIFLFQNYFL